MRKLLTIGVVLTTIVWTMGVAAFVPVASAATLSAGDLIKASGPAVYYYAADGERYTFPTESTFMSWYDNFDDVITITDDELAAIDLAGNIVVRPGTKLIKITTVPKVYAVGPNGALRHIADEDAAVALYGEDWTSMVIDIPDGFWNNYADTDDALDGTEFPEGQLVKEEGGSDVYYVNEDGSWSRVADETTFNANGWNWDHVVTTDLEMPSEGDEIDEALYHDTSQGGGGAEVVVGQEGELMVSLSSDTPATQVVPTNATAAAANVALTKVNFKAGSEAVTITGLKVTRTGLSQDAAIDSVKLFDGTAQVGNSQSLNSSHQASFNNISISVPANSTKTITLAATMANVATYDGNILVLGINSASDITTSAAVSGSFPISGNSATLNSGVTIGTAILYNGSIGNRNGTDLTVDTDETDVRFTQVKITAGSAEAIKVTQVTAVKNGTASSDDVKNIRLVNDDTGETLGTVASLDSSGRAVFDCNIEVGKGKSVELGILADMNNSGAGRTLAFDLHDGTAYTISIVGADYGFGIIPTRNNFCSAAGTCTVQSINQGYLTLALSADSPATGFISIGDTEVPLLTYEANAGGEDINVTSTVITITTGTALKNEITQVSIYDEDGNIVAGPKDGSGATAGAQTLTFTDAYTIPNGASKYTVKANMATTMSANDTVVASIAAGAITAKGADSGKTTYTTSAGTTVPPATAVTGKTQTIKGPVLNTITAATPVITTFVANTQNAELAYFDLDATAGGEDIKVSQIDVTNTVAGAAVVTDWGNLELWGDPDNTDDDDSIVRLETTSSTSTGAATNTFTFKTPIKVSKSKISRLTLKADLIATTAVGAGNTHTFNVGAGTDVTAVGWSTGGTVTKTVSGAGQAHLLAANGSLKITAGADRTVAAQFVAGTTGNSMMSYKLQAVNEEADITDFYIATTGATASADIAKVKLYLDGELIGSANGYTLDAGGDAHIVLDSGTFIAKKSPEYSLLEIKVDLANKDNLSDTATLEIGLGDATGTDATWGANGAEGIATTSYLMVATGRSSGVTITATDINSTGVNATGKVVASYVHYLYDGILTVKLDENSPGGTSTAGANKQLLKAKLTAVGDDITINDIEFVTGGTCTVAGAATTTLKSSDLQTTYATWTAAVSLNGATPQDWNFSVDELNTTWDTALQIEAGQSKTVVLVGDTTGCTTNETLQVSIDAPTAGNGTTAGIEWQNSSANNVDSALTKDLPVIGNSFSY